MAINPAWREVDVMGKYPGTCVITNYPNSHTHTQIFDLGFDIPGYGRVYVTDSGAYQIAEAFGYTDAETTAAQDERIAELEAENAALRAKLGALPTTIEGFLNDLHARTRDLVGDLFAVPGGDDGADDPRPAEGSDAAERAGDEVPDGDERDEAAAAAVA